MEHLPDLTLTSLDKAHPQNKGIYKPIHGGKFLELSIIGATSSQNKIIEICIFLSTYAHDKDNK